MESEKTGSPLDGPYTTIDHSSDTVRTGLVLLVVQEALFFKVPLEIAYLLPVLFMATPLFVVWLQPKTSTMLALLGLVLSYGFIVNPDILDRRYNASGNEAIGAEVGLFLRPGVVVVDLLARRGSAEQYFAEYRIPSKATVPEP